ncbi:MAG: fibro-slime domain-containing protein [Deltaproteobacteria bacterium]|nr:fibro-slime domain-containing protein [Deltaproteobacteria bacterium]
MTYYNHKILFAVSLFLLSSCAQAPDESTDSDSLIIDTASDSNFPGGECSNVVEVTFRDFTELHPDFERADKGWGPVKGLIADTLDSERKPVYNKIRGNCQLQPNGTCIPTADWNNIPMWGIQDDDGKWNAEETFYTWYRDSDLFKNGFGWIDREQLSRTLKKSITLEKSSENPENYIFDSSQFFPLSLDEGFGESPKGSGKNYLFTTEIHLKFEYIENQIFTFRGDDDLWIFVNDRLILDLGGMHAPAEGVIDFDAQQLNLNITPGNIYSMDIFHAERHTDQSNFRIETNIRCFVPVSID